MPFDFPVTWQTKVASTRGYDDLGSHGTVGNCDWSDRQEVSNETSQNRLTHIISFKRSVTNDYICQGLSSWCQKPFYRSLYLDRSIVVRPQWHCLILPSIERFRALGQPTGHPMVALGSRTQTARRAFTMRTSTKFNES
jgi:hypothetical protein